MDWLIGLFDMLGGALADWLIGLVFSPWFSVHGLIGLFDMLGGVVAHWLIDWLLLLIFWWRGTSVYLLLCFSTDILAGEQEGGDNNFSGLVDSFLAYAEKNGIPEGCVFLESQFLYSFYSYRHTAVKRRGSDF